MSSNPECYGTFDEAFRDGFRHGKRGAVPFVDVLPMLRHLRRFGIPVIAALMAKLTDAQRQEVER